MATRTEYRTNGQTSIWTYSPNYYNQIRKDRKQIQRIKKVSDNEVMKNFCCNMYIPPESGESEYLKNFDRILISLTKLSGFYQKVRIVE